MGTGVSPKRIITNNDPYENRTRVTAVKGRCLDRLTNGPYVCFLFLISVVPLTCIILHYNVTYVNLFFKLFLVFFIKVAKTL